MERIDVAGITEVIVDRGLPDPVLPERKGRQRAAILTQPGPIHRATEFASAIESRGVTAEVIQLPDRDEAKTLDTASTVYEALARLGLARDDTVVGVGGGSVTDLSGFVAGTWLRGVESVNVPTTLLGAVDAAIGGKTGVNSSGKNMVGVIWHPSRVIVDLRTLAELPASLRRDGLAEALKTGLVADPSLADLVASGGLDAPMREVVVSSLRAKSRIVSEDEADHGRRAILNFGHTIGHAIEFASSISHGEAVGLGMIAAAFVSEKRLGFPDAARVVGAVTNLGLPTQLSGLEVARVTELLRMDKKRDEGGQRMVLLREVGAPVIEHVDPSDVEVGLASIGLGVL